MTKRDLFVVVADLDAENSIKTLLLERQNALRISLGFLPSPPPNGDLLRYSGRDSGCYTRAVDLLRPPQKTHRHALILFDLHGSGTEQRLREDVEEEIESLLHKNGWASGDAAAIVIDPELEAWAWSDSDEAAAIMGWNEGMHDLRKHLVSKKLWLDTSPKPSYPKSAMKEAVRIKQLRGGTAPLFKKMGQHLNFSSCADQAFYKLQKTLQSWFPAPARVRS